MLVKEKLKKNIPTIGSWIQIGNPVVAEIMARAGFDWLAIDLEHSVIGLDMLQSLFQAMAPYDVEPFVRLTSNNPDQIKRVLDAGCRGIIVPNICSAGEIQTAIRAAMYPPEGIRGIGLARAQAWGENFQDYFKTVNEKLVIIAQIEHKDGVENIKEIVRVEGLDGILIGPYDISGSYGIAGKFDDPIMVKAEEKLCNAARAANVAMGIHIVAPLLTEVKKRMADGYTFLAYSVDTVILARHVTEVVKELKK